MRICRQCGNTYEDEIKFCPVCGCIVEDFAAEMSFQIHPRENMLERSLGLSLYVF